MEALISKLKEQLIEQLNLEDYTPEDINEDDSLFESEMGLDSIDALEIIVLLEQEYGVKIQNKEDGEKIFHSVRTIAEHIQANS